MLRVAGGTLGAHRRHGTCGTADVAGCMEDRERRGGNVRWESTRQPVAWRYKDSTRMNGRRTYKHEAEYVGVLKCRRSRAEQSTIGSRETRMGSDGHELHF